MNLLMEIGDGFHTLSAIASWLKLCSRSHLPSSQGFS
ncbi:hypothetical protein SPLC1_S102340 [Arthrospira platensis C1]|nr:hypothetical protein SPLC1_S102340 [Arthrospira platensis C1]